MLAGQVPKFNTPLNTVITGFKPNMCLVPAGYVHSDAHMQAT